MKRYYGSAVFEGEEVADSDLIILQDIRSLEARRVAAHEWEFKMQIDELNYWLDDELAIIKSNATRQINAEYNFMYQCYNKINQLHYYAQAAIYAVKMQMFLQFHTHGTSAENAAIALIRADVESRIAELYARIRRAYSNIASIQSNRQRAIARAHADYRIEYYIRLDRRNKDIAWTHSEATRAINNILSRRYNLPVFMLRCAKGACDFCLEKSATIGTESELVKIRCIPPFHKHCRCLLEEVGYVVMSGV
jgi:hypothetical protein